MDLDGNLCGCNIFDAMIMRFYYFYQFFSNEIALFRGTVIILCMFQLRRRLGADIFLRSLNVAAILPSHVTIR